jgi:predicted nucleotidyltransferase
MLDSIQTLESVLKKNQVLERYHLDKLGVFGSFARGEAAHDIDFYIDKDEYNLKNMLALKNELESITHMTVDIMLKKYANPIVLYRAQKDMQYVIQ